MRKFYRLEKLLKIKPSDLSESDRMLLEYNSFFKKAYTIKYGEV